MRKDKTNKGMSLDKLFRQAILAPISRLVFAVWLEDYVGGTNKEKGVAGHDSPPLEVTLGNVSDTIVTDKDLP
jgi:hypothetical protein